MRTEIVDLSQYQCIPTKEEYFKHPALSYSTLKDIYYNPQLLERDRKTSSYMDLGSAVDILLTSVDEIDRIQIINKLPADNYRNMADFILNNYPDILKTEDISDKIILEAYDHVDSQARWLIDTKRKNFIQNAETYFNVLALNSEAILLTPDLHSLAMNISTMLKNHELTKHLFTKKEDIKVFFQFKTLYKVNDVEYKAMFDILELDNKNETIKIYDLKIGNYSFMSSFLQFKWYYQAVLYQTALDSLADELMSDSNIVYTLEPFTFIYVNTMNPTYPTLYTMPSKLSNIILEEGINQGFYRIPAVKDLYMAATYYLEQLATSSKEIKDLVPYEYFIHDGNIPITHSYKEKFSLVY